ncbi:alpha/beta fold hydrolase [Microbacterium sp. M1A1_1b]
MFSHGVSDVDGRPVAWRHRPGPGAPVLLLHGGLADGRTFDPMAMHLSPDLDLWTFDRRGHGRTPDSPAPFSYADMLAETVTVLGRTVDTPVHLVGHSDGADLALLLAVTHPELVLSVSAFSANLDPSGYRAGSVTVDQMVAAVGSSWAEVSPDPPEHLPVVVAKVLHLWATEPTMTADDVGRITCPVLVAAGADDVVLPEHTAAIAAAVSGAQLSIVPGTSHMAITEDPATCAALVTACIARAVRATG